MHAPDDQRSGLRSRAEAECASRLAGAIAVYDCLVDDKQARMRTLRLPAIEHVGCAAGTIAGGVICAARFDMEANWTGVTDLGDRRSSNAIRTP